MTRHSFNWFEKSTRRKSLGEIIRKNGPRGVLLLVLTFCLAGAFVLIACEPGYDEMEERERVRVMAREHRAPQWFPGGDRIVFNDRGAVYVIDYTGSQLIKVGGSTGTHQDTAFAPSVSPDGSRIAYAHYTDNWEIMTANPDGSDQRRLTHNDTDDVGPVWLPDGTSVVFLSNVSRPYHWGISTVVVEGSDPPSGPVRVSYGYHGSGTLKLSPDGNHLTFRGSMHDGLYYPVALYVSEADGSGLTKLADGGESMSHPAWSPDSRRIAFARDEDNDRAGPPSGRYTRSALTARICVRSLNSTEEIIPGHQALHGPLTALKYGLDRPSSRRTAPPYGCSRDLPASLHGLLMVPGWRSRPTSHGASQAYLLLLATTNIRS